ncbi:MAG: DUF4845 domain-containing protein [Betaproteobacteria bacterium]
MYQRMRQRGLSMIGFLFVTLVVVIAVLLGFTITPAFIEYYSVTKALEKTLVATKDLNSAKDIRNEFQRVADAGYIDSVGGRDIEITKNKNEITLSISWTRKLHLIGNASLLLEFDASATR